MELTPLRYLRAIADAGTMTVAAQRLGLSQPTLSAAVRKGHFSRLYTAHEKFFAQKPATHQKRMFELYFRPVREGCGWITRDGRCPAALACRQGGFARE